MDGDTPSRKPEREVARTPAVRWLECVRDHAARIDALHRELMGLEQARDEVVPWTVSGSGGGSAGAHSDPTSTLAQARIEGLERMISERRAAYDESIRIVGECGTVIERMRRELSGRHADVIELYYLDCLPTWTDVAHEMGAHRNSVRTWRIESYAWIDAHCARFLL